MHIYFISSYSCYLILFNVLISFYIIRVKSPIDGQLMDGIPSIRVHNGTDYKGTTRFIRWTEVFIIKVYILDTPY